MASTQDLAFVASAATALTASSFTPSIATATPHHARPLHPPRRALLRMQDVNGSPDDENEEAPSDTPTLDATATVVEGTAPTDASASASRESLIAQVLQLAAVTNRGQFASSAQQTRMLNLVADLDAMNPNPAPVDTPIIDGVWELVYFSGKLAKTSPLLLAAATPLLSVGQIKQTVYVDGGELTTEVEVVAFPEISGTVSTSARITPVSPERLEISVEKSTLRGGSIAGKVDLGGINFDVPVAELYQRLRGGAVPETYVDTTYLDEKLRVGRCKGGKVYVFARM